MDDLEYQKKWKDKGYKICEKYKPCWDCVPKIKSDLLKMEEKKRSSGDGKEIKYFMYKCDSKDCKQEAKNCE